MVSATALMRSMENPWPGRPVDKGVGRNSISLPTRIHSFFRCSMAREGGPTCDSEDNEGEEQGSKGEDGTEFLSRSFRSFFSFVFRA